MSLKLLSVSNEAIRHLLFGWNIDFQSELNQIFSPHVVENYFNEIGFWIGKRIRTHETEKGELCGQMDKLFIIIWPLITKQICSWQCNQMLQLKVTNFFTKKVAFSKISKKVCQILGQLLKGNLFQENSPICLYLFLTTLCLIDLPQSKRLKYDPAQSNIFFQMMNKTILARRIACYQSSWMEHLPGAERRSRIRSWNPDAKLLKWSTLRPLTSSSITREVPRRSSVGHV